MSRGSISLLTIMAYLDGGVFDLDKIFDKLEAYPIYSPPKKKNGSVDIEKVKVPKDQIISIQYGQYIKGLESKKTKPTGDYEITVVKKNGKKKTYVDEYENIDDYDNVDRIKRPGNKKTFPHQITLIYSFQPGVNINMFIFSKSIKIAGFKSQEPCERMVRKLWKKHIVHVEQGIIMEKDRELSFIFESAMTNTKFETPYKYKLTRVNTILNRLKELEGEDSPIIISTYETTGDTGVTLKLKADKPKGYKHKKWTWDGDRFVGTTCKVIPTQRKTDDQKCTTITLYDKKYLMSFRYDTLVEETAEFFESILSKYAEKINVEINPDIERFVPVFV